MTAARWVITRHAEERRELRQFSLAEVLWACERPETSVPSKHDIHIQRRFRGRCCVVVDPGTFEVIPVFDPNVEDERTQHALYLMDNGASVKSPRPTPWPSRSGC